MSANSTVTLGKSSAMIPSLLLQARGDRRGQHVEQQALGLGLLELERGAGGRARQRPLPGADEVLEQRVRRRRDAEDVEREERDDDAAAGCRARRRRAPGRSRRRPRRGRRTPRTTGSAWRAPTKSERPQRRRDRPTGRRPRSSRSRPGSTAARTAAAGSCNSWLVAEQRVAMRAREGVDARRRRELVDEAGSPPTPRARARRTSRPRRREAWPSASTTGPAPPCEPRARPESDGCAPISTSRCSQPGNRSNPPTKPTLHHAASISLPRRRTRPPAGATVRLRASAATRRRR